MPLVVDGGGGWRSGPNRQEGGPGWHTGCGALWSQVADARWTLRRFPTSSPRGSSHLHQAQRAQGCRPARSSGAFPPRQLRRLSRGCGSLPGAEAEPEPAGRSGVSSPSSLLSLGRCSGGGALRLRTFHSSLHTPSSGQSLIGHTWSDVTASFFLSPLHPRPRPPQASPRLAIGVPLPQRMGWGEGTSVFVWILSLWLPHLLPACHVFIIHCHLRL